MSKYATGEVATQLGVSVRTIQYYDRCNLVNPSEFSEGGRRLYSSEDVKKLKVVCYLRSLGFSISALKDLLKEENSPKVIELLLNQQIKELKTELKSNQEKIEELEDLVKIVKKDGLVTEKIVDVDKKEQMENKKNLKKMRAKMLVFGILIELVEDGLIALGIIYKLWWLVALGVVFVLVTVPFLISFYYKSTLYQCPECDNVFKPKFWRFFFSKHTFKTRKLVCPNCNKKSWCVEVYDNENN